MTRFETFHFWRLRRLSRQIAVVMYRYRVAW